MRALLLPNESPAESKRICALIDGKGHYGIDLSSKYSRTSFLEEFGRADVVIAAGQLTQDGIWLWGYSFACKKKVLAVKCVIPCYASRMVNIENWVESLPTQGELFKNEYKKS